MVMTTQLQTGSNNRRLEQVRDNFLEDCGQHSMMALRSFVLELTAPFDWTAFVNVSWPIAGYVMSPVALKILFKGSRFRFFSFSSHFPNCELMKGPLMDQLNR